MTDDRELVTAFLRHRGEADFRELYRRHTPYLFGIAHRVAGGATDVAEDLVEEAWLRALQRLDRFEWRSRLRTWLAGILLNCHRERARTDARAAPMANGVDLVAASPAVPPEDTIDLENALARLADGYREVVVLYHVYGYTHAEIGEVLGISTGTSKSQLARGLTRLREMWTPPGAETESD